MDEPSKTLPAQTHLLFAQVQFYIVPSLSLEGEPADAVRGVLMTYVFQVNSDQRL